MKYIKQEDKCGCSVACLAMITGKPYAEVKSWFKHVDFDKDGLVSEQQDSFLAEHGYAVARKWKYTTLQTEKKQRVRDEWPPKPFGTVHLCHVYDDIKVGHAVVMLADGSILDPKNQTKYELLDYKNVMNVAAITKIVDVGRLKFLEEFWERSRTEERKQFEMNMEARNKCENQL